MNDGFRVFTTRVKPPLALAGQVVCYVDVMIGGQQRTLNFVCEPRDVLPIPYGVISGCTMGVDGPELLKALRKLSESFDDQHAPERVRYGLGCPDCGVLVTDVHHDNCPRAKGALKNLWYCVQCDFGVVTVTTEANAHVKEACTDRRMNCKMTQQKPPEAVDHPAHYGGADDPYEVIKVLEAWLTPEEFRGALKFNIIKYNARARRKDGDQDYAKALWYQRYLDDYNRRMRERADRRVPRHDQLTMTGNEA